MRRVRCRAIEGKKEAFASLKLPSVLDFPLRWSQKTADITIRQLPIFFSMGRQKKDQASSEQLRKAIGRGSGYIREVERTIARARSHSRPIAKVFTVPQRFFRKQFLFDAYLPMKLLSQRSSALLIDVRAFVENNRTHAWKPLTPEAKEKREKLFQSNYDHWRSAFTRTSQRFQTN